MRSDVEDLARWLLSRETTQSMSASLLRDRLVERLGEQVGTRTKLLRELADSPKFLVLDAPLSLRETFTDDAGIASWGDVYDNALRLAMADADVRVMLAAPAPDDERVPPDTPLDLVIRSVFTMSAGAASDAALRQALNTALVETDAAERVLRDLIRAAASPAEDSAQSEAEHSTTPLRDPPRPARSRPTPPRRSSRSPRSGESH